MVIESDSDGNDSINDELNMLEKWKGQMDKYDIGFKEMEQVPRRSRS